MLVGTLDSMRMKPLIMDYRAGLITTAKLQFAIVKIFVLNLKKNEGDFLKNLKSSIKTPVLDKTTYNIKQDDEPTLTITN